MADVVRLGTEGKLLEVLAGVGELGSEEADGPRQLHPEHEQRQGSKRAVDGVVAGEEDLAIDVEILQQLHGHTSEDAWHDGILQLHTGVGEEHVEGDEHSRHDDIGHEADEEPHGRAQEHIALHLLGNGGEEDGHTRREHDGDGCQEEERDVVGNLARPGPLLLHLPNLVERDLHVVNQREHGPEHEDQADAQDDAAMRVHQIGVDEPHDDIGGLWLTRQHVDEPLLDVLVEAKATRDGKHHSHHGHDGQERGVSECRGSSHHTLVDEELYGQIELLEHGNPHAMLLGSGVMVHAPDVDGQKLYQRFQFAHLRLFSLLTRSLSSFRCFRAHSAVCVLKKECSVPVSRVLFLPDGRPPVMQVPAIYLVRESPRGSSVLPSIASSGELGRTTLGQWYT